MEGGERLAALVVAVAVVVIPDFEEVEEGKKKVELSTFVQGSHKKNKKRRHENKTKQNMSDTRRRRPSS